MNSSNASISLEQLTVLNDEIAALVAAGVPLNRGLLDLGRDVPGRLGRIAHDLGERLERGESLEAALLASDSQFPPVYRAVVVAGERSGRLAVALEGLSETARRLVELRRAIGLALIYPLLIIAGTYLVFLFVITHVMPTLVEVQQFNGEATTWVRWLATMGENVSSWAYYPPVVVGVLLAIAWWRSTFLNAASGRAWTPWGRLRRAGCLATLTEVLAILVEHHAPLDQAIELAGQASGDRRLQADCSRLAERLRRGETIAPDEARALAVPPLVAWLLLSAGREGALVESLRHAADQYTRRARRLADWFSFQFPLYLTASVAGGVVLVYAIVALLPWFQTMQRLADPF